MEFIAYPIGHASNTLTRTLDHPIVAFSTVRQKVERARANRGATNPSTDYNVRTHDYNMFKSLMDSLTDLAPFRLLDTIRNRKLLVDTLPRGVKHHRANSAASLAHHQGAHQHGAATHTHRTRTTPAPLCTAIT